MLVTKTLVIREAMRTELRLGMPKVITKSDSQIAIKSILGQSQA